MEKKQDILTRQFAEARSSAISEVNYNLFLNLKENAKKFSGNCKISFNLSKKQDVKIDIIAKIISVKINNKSSKFKKEEFAIIIPESSTIEGNNIAEIDYEAEYSATGEGLHHFIDSEDSSEYIYSDLEPYDAHKMFPCFDQPDIKATYELKVSSPKKWRIISNTQENSVKEKGNEKITEFSRTKKFSTYLFHVSAGPYEIFKDKYKKINLTLHCRKTMKKYLPHKEIFKITKQGLQFYEKYFDFQYPFEKYSQIFIPEFNSLAMENVGAVTFTEKLLRRRALTRVEKSLLANVILHEMAHMWFGNLVTMKWWNDLWLNESFADIMAYISMAEAAEFKEAWEDFYIRKAWGYYQDQLPTTHPIANSSKDTNEAFSSFDGISYAKGAAVLKQLMFLIGEKNFKKGIQNYFKKFQWQNAELKDFLSALESSSKKPLKKWANQWLLTTGVNTITSKCKTKKGKITKFKITQMPSAKNNLLRGHKTLLGLFYKNKIEKIPITYSAKKIKIKELKNKPLPELIYLNCNDQDYVKTPLNTDAINYIMNNFQKIKDPLLKQMLFGSLWQMVRDAEISPKILLELIIKYSSSESNSPLLERMFLLASRALNFYLNENSFLKYSEILNTLSLQALQKQKNAVSSDNKTLWFSLFLSTSSAINNNSVLINILNKKIKFPNLKIDQDKRWNILVVLAAKNYHEAEELIKKELKKDNSDKGRKSFAKAESSMLKHKEKYWNLFIKKNSHSLDYLKEAMSGFYWRTQKAKLEKYRHEFFSSVKNIFEEKDNHYSKAFFEFLFPNIFVNKNALKNSQKFIKNNPSIHPLLKKYLAETNDELRRGIDILEKYP